MSLALYSSRVRSNDLLGRNPGCSALQRLDICALPAVGSASENNRSTSRRHGLQEYRDIDSSGRCMARPPGNLRLLCSKTANRELVWPVHEAAREGLTFAGDKCCN